MDYPLEQFLASYEQLKNQYKNRQISQQQFVDKIKQIRGRDQQGVFWVADPYRDQFLRYDGRQWVVDNSIKTRKQAQPVQPAPRVQPVQPQSNQGKFVEVPDYKQTASASAPVQAQKPVFQNGAQAKKSPLSKRSIKGIPFLALIPGLFCGGAWFLYTFIGVFKTEGLRGVDFLTPAIIVVVPAVFWLFGKQIDKLLTPLHPLIGPFPKPVRYGIVLGVPVILGCGCSLLSSSGYGFLHLSTLISALVAGVLIRIPEVKK